MRIVIDYPPLFDEIDACFRVRGKHGVLYAWGDRIYNPSGVHVSDELIAHERVHGTRQGSDITGWWRRYMAEPAFRLEEEIAAHRAEYEWLAGHGSRNERRAALKRVAARLASPLYGRMVTPADAKRALTGG